MSVCPALRRVVGGFICKYTDKSVDPFDWHCLGNYSACPIYIEKAERNRQPAVERQSTETQQQPTVESPPQQPTVETQQQPTAAPEQQVVQLTAVEPITVVVSSASTEEIIKSAVDDVMSKYEELIKKLDESWRSYEAAVLSYRRQWEVEKLRLRHTLSLLSSTISNYEKALNELDLKRDLMPEDQYDKARQEIEKELDELRTIFNAANEDYNAIEDVMNQHLKRVLTTSTNADVMNLRLSLSRLDDLLKEGKISREAYEELKKELEAIS